MTEDNQPEAKQVNTDGGSYIEGDVKPIASVVVTGGSVREINYHFHQHPEQKAQPEARLVWNIPHLRNPNFVGRDGLLTALDEAWRAGEGVAALTQALHGLGGVGKTQTAVEFAYRHAKDFGIVWWVRAEEGATLTADYAALAAALGLPEQMAQDQAVVVEAVRDWLDSHTGWLLIFDNAEEPGHLRDLLPRLGQGYTLITSRNPDWGKYTSRLNVPVLAKEAAIEFLLKRSGDNDREAAGVLAEELGYLPLALEQAAAYCAACQTGLADYLAMFKKDQLSLLDEQESQPDERDYPASVVTTWKLSFEAVEKSQPAGADLLRLCAFLAPDNISLGDLAAGAEYLPEGLAGCVQDKRSLNRVLGALRRYSLVERADGTLSVHRLVQAVTRDSLNGDEYKQWAGAAVSVILESFPFQADDYQTWKECERLLAHGLVSCEYAEKVNTKPETTGNVLIRASLYLQGRADYRTARSYTERALKLYEAAYGPDHPEVAVVLNNLGLRLQDMGEYAAAKPYIERALKISEAALGPDHPTVATDLNNLGSLLYAEGDYQAAKPLFERAIKIDEAVYGPDHPEVATDLNNLGSLLYAEGDYQAAKPLFERALKIAEATLGPDHPNIASGLSNLGNLLKEMGEYAAARPYIERALMISEAALGPDHPNVARDLNNLGLVLKEMGEYAAAKPYIERALRIDEAALGPDHPQVAIFANNLGSLLKAMGEYAAALPYIERALRIVEAALGPDHPQVATFANNLGSVLQDMGEYAAALPYIERALMIGEATLGPDHPNVAIRLNNLGTLLYTEGDYQAAKPYFERTLAIFKKALGENHPSTVTVRQNLAILENLL